MASALATPATSSSKETTNYTRLCRVLVDVGTCALRDSFDAICTPPTLHTFLAANQPTLQSLRSWRIINATQWGKLFPAIPASVSSRDFEITLLMILLRNVCGLAPPLTGWDSLPAATLHCANQIPQKYSVRSRWTRFCWWCNIRQTLERHPGHSGAIRRSCVRGKRFLENVRYDFTFLHLVPCNCFGVESTCKPGNDYVISSTRRPLLTTCSFAV